MIRESGEWCHFDSLAPSELAEERGDVALASPKRLREGEGSDRGVFNPETESPGADSASCEKINLLSLIIRVFITLYLRNYEKPLKNIAVVTIT